VKCTTLLQSCRFLCRLGVKFFDPARVPDPDPQHCTELRPRRSWDDEPVNSIAISHKIRDAPVTDLPGFSLSSMWPVPVPASYILYPARRKFRGISNHTGNIYFFLLKHSSILWRNIKIFKSRRIVHRPVFRILIDYMRIPDPDPEF
jgi:hypothetical protein